MDDLVAVVLARGVGSRMKRRDPGGPALPADQQDAADAGLKGMMPIAPPGASPRPFLDYALHALADAGYDDVVMVVAPDHAPMRDYYEGPGRPRRTRITWAVQREPLGTADAVRSAEDAVGARPFIVLNGDNLYPAAALRELRALGEPGLVAFGRHDLSASGHLSADRIAGFAIVATTPDGHLSDIVEKPQPDVLAAAGDRALVSMNCWRFDRQIFDACRATPRSARGEFELTGAVRVAIAQGVSFAVRVAAGPVLDLSLRSDIAAVEAQLAHRDVRP